VTIQAQILDLMRTLRAETGTAGDPDHARLGVVAEFADDVLVMYAGRIVERRRCASCSRIRSIRIRSACSGRSRVLDIEQDRLATIDGQVPMRLVAGPGAAPSRRAVRSPPDVPRRGAASFGQGGRHLAACWNAPLEAADAGTVEEATPA
jgi:ABC-type dipeptide/oligopeptide/nickel transport system ATPase component